MSPKKLIYLAGPVRNENINKRHNNILRGEAASVRLWKMGFAVICPHKNTEFVDGAVPDEDILNGDLQIVRRCDAAVFMKNWQSSEGALKEHDYCIIHDIPIFYLEDAYCTNKLEALRDGTWDVVGHLIHQRKVEVKGVEQHVDAVEEDIGIILAELAEEPDILPFKKPLPDEGIEKLKCLSGGHDKEKYKHLVEQIVRNVVSPQDRYLSDLFHALMVVAAAGGDHRSVSKMIDRLNELHKMGALT